MKTRIFVLALALVCGQPSFAAKPCEELKAEIAASIEANGVQNYTLTIVANDQVGDRKVVGSCDGGTNKIVYERGAAGAAPAAAPPAAAPTAVKSEPPAPAAAK